MNQFKNEEEIRGSRKIQEVSVKVWKSRGFKDAPTIFMFFFLFFGFMGSLLVGAGESNEKGFGVVIVVLGIIFLGLFILFKTKGIGKEDYRIGLNYQDGTLWVNRPSKKKMLKEEWAGKIVKFHMVKTKNSRMITGRGPGGVPRRVVDTSYELQVSLSGRDYLWPVPGSVFFSKKDANAVLNQVNYLL